MKKGICKKGHIMTDDSNSYLRKDGGRTCKQCSQEKNKARRNNPVLYAKLLENQRKDYLENPEKYKERNRMNWEKHKEKYLQQKKESFPKTLRKIKEEVMTHYGNGKLACVCCGEDHIAFLTIDHVNGRQEHEKGSISNRSKYSGRALWSYLKRNGYPEGYETTCWNCNSGKQINGGICPHKVKIPKIIITQTF